MEVINKFKPLDERFSLKHQLGISAAPIVLINIFKVDAADEADFLENFEASGSIFTKQPGHISSQLHRAVGDSPIFFNYVVWESTETLRAAFANPKFVAKVSSYPASVVASPHLFQKIAVPGLCTA